jgi:hypothetical protein
MISSFYYQQSQLPSRRQLTPPPSTIPSLAPPGLPRVAWGYTSTRRVVRSVGSGGSVGDGGLNHTATRGHMYSTIPNRSGPAHYFSNALSDSGGHRGRGKCGGGEEVRRKSRRSRLASMLGGVGRHRRERGVVRLPQPWFCRHLLTRRHSSSSPPEPGGIVDGETHRMGGGDTPRGASMCVSDGARIVDGVLGTSVTSGRVPPSVASRCCSAV